METEFDTFGITLPVKTWKSLMALAGKFDRAPSDYLRTLIHREAVRELTFTSDAQPTPEGARRVETGAGRQA